MTLGMVLKQARLAKGESMSKAAAALGCSEMTYTMWERDAWSPKPDRAAGIAQYTGKSKAAILGLLGVLDDEEVRALTRARTGRRSTQQ